MTKEDDMVEIIRAEPQPIDYSYRCTICGATDGVITHYSYNGYTLQLCYRCFDVLRTIITKIVDGEI